MVNAKKWIISKAFQGEPKVTDFKLVVEELPPLKDGGDILFSLQDVHFNCIIC
jgi:hypothetical protein